MQQITPNPSTLSEACDFGFRAMDRIDNVTCTCIDQVLIHQDTWKVLVKMRKEAQADSDMLENILFRNMGKHTLKGIIKSVYIIQVRARSEG